jgi:osmotically-inducible protein OsmY
MFVARSHSFTRAAIIGGLLSLPFAITDARAAATTQAQAAQPAQAQPAQATPDSQLVAKIRQALADDKALTGYASTLKIVASDGLVTLKGAVKSDADKKAVGAKADQIAGEKNVMNNLIVAPSQASAATPPTR